jgi:hypothetical protein
MEKRDSLALWLLAAKLIRVAHTDGYDPPYDLHVMGWKELDCKLPNKS